MTLSSSPVPLFQSLLHPKFKLGENCLWKISVDQFFHLSLSDLKHNHLTCYLDIEYIDVSTIIQFYVVHDDGHLHHDDDNNEHNNLLESWSMTLITVKDFSTRKPTL
jgi:hypothetical protein